MLPASWRAFASIAALLIVPVTAAHARGLRRFQFRVDVTTGKAQQLSEASGGDANSKRPKPGGGRRLAPAARLPNSARLDNEAGTAILRDQAGAERLRIPMSQGKNDWSPWAIPQGGLIIFAWREATRAPAPHDYRDVWRAADVHDGHTLWRREMPYHDAPGAAPFNERAVIVDGDDQIEIVDSRTGATMRTLAKSDESFSLTDAHDGLLVEAGGEVHLVERSTGADRWRVRKRGTLISWTPLAPGQRALMQTNAATYLIDTRAGKIVWQSASPSNDELWLVGNRIYEPTLQRRSRDDTIVGLTVRRLEDGARVAQHVVQHMQGFFDTGAAAITDVRDGKVDIETTWIVLD